MNRLSSEDIRLVLNHHPTLGKIHTSVAAFVSFDHEMTYDLESMVNRWIDQSAAFDRYGCEPIRSESRQDFW